MNITCPVCNTIFVLEVPPEAFASRWDVMGEECPNCGYWLDAGLAWDEDRVSVTYVEVQPDEFQDEHPSGDLPGVD